MLIIPYLIMQYYHWIADEISLNENEPYVEILEVLEDALFVAKRAKTFEEEKKVANKAPVNNINISDLNI